MKNQKTLSLPSKKEAKFQLSILFQNWVLSENTTPKSMVKMTKLYLRLSNLINKHL